MRNYIHTRTCVYNINYHLVWCVKYRKKVLTQTICDRLYDILYQIADEKAFTIIECKAGGQDHIHCFLSAPPTLSVTQIVKSLKGISASILFKEYPELRDHLWKGKLWSGSYFCETIGSTSQENIEQYIRRQKNCQL